MQRTVPRSETNFTIALRWKTEAADFASIYWKSLHLVVSLLKVLWSTLMVCLSSKKLHLLWMTWQATVICEYQLFLQSVAISFWKKEINAKILRNGTGSECDNWGIFVHFLLCKENGWNNSGKQQNLRFELSNTDQITVLAIAMVPKCNWRLKLYRRIYDCQNARWAVEMSIFSYRLK